MARGVAYQVGKIGVGPRGSNRGLINASNSLIINAIQNTSKQKSQTKNNVYIMKKLTIFVVALALFSLSLVSVGCSNPDDNVQPGTGYVEPDKSVPDPSGTIMVNLGTNTHSLSQVYDQWLGLCTLTLDNYDNFDVDGGKICCIGKVAGLSNVCEAPTDSKAWDTVAAVVPGYGYIVRGDGGGYARIYVVEWIPSSVIGALACATIKTESPFTPTNISVIP